MYSELLAQFPDLHALHVSLALCGFMSGDTEGSTAHADAYLASLVLSGSLPVSLWLHALLRAFARLHRLCPFPATAEGAP